MNEFEIKISGSGTREEITAALEALVNSLKDSTVSIDDSEFEDPTLMTEIYSIN